jgi:hypothetical protein
VASRLPQRYLPAVVPDVGRPMADGRCGSSPPPRARLSGLGRAGGHRDAGAPHLAVVQPPQVYQAGARLPVQVVGRLHVAEPGMVKTPSSSSHRSMGSPTVAGCPDSWPDQREFATVEYATLQYVDGPMTQRRRLLA